MEMACECGLKLGKMPEVMTQEIMQPDFIDYVIVQSKNVPGKLAPDCEFNENYFVSIECPSAQKAWDACVEIGQKANPSLTWTENDPPNGVINPFSCQPLIKVHGDEESE
jgi:hypothetical protein